MFTKYRQNKHHGKYSLPFLTMQYEYKYIFINKNKT